MKNKIVYFLMMLVVLVSCGEDFTEVPAYGSLSDDALQNAEGIDLKLIGAYSLLDGMSDTGNSDWEKAPDGWWYDVMSDDAHKGSTDGDQADLFLLEVMDWGSTNPYIGGRWRSLFAGVNRANAVIDLIGLITEGDFSQQMAEARFLRGHYNFEIQKMWGNVPYISEENYANIEFNQPNPGPIWAEIEADFQAAMGSLPATQDQVGRPTKWTAQAFLAKAQLFQGKWAEAKSNFGAVINSGVYSLLPEFVDNFRLAGDNSVESVFAIQFTADAGQSYNANRGGTLNFSGPNGWCCGFYQPTQDLVNAYQTSGGLPLIDTYNQTDVTNDYGINSADPFTPHTGPLDPRLDYTVGRRGINYNNYIHTYKDEDDNVIEEYENPGKDWIRASFADISGPYLTKKGVYYNGEDANMGTGGWGQQRSGINYHLMRYADVLLMAAEAAAETGDNATALDYVNQVRTRAMDMTPVKAKPDEFGNQADAANYDIGLYAPGDFGSKEEAIKRIRFERRLEFGMEGHRLFDIRRWGIGVQTMNAYFVNEGRTITSFAGKPAAYTSTNDISPIPLGAIDLSGNILQQNPGY